MRTSSGAQPLQPNQTGPLQSGPAHHHPIPAVGCMASRILSRNANGTSKSMVLLYAIPLLCHSNTLSLQSAPLQFTCAPSTKL